MEFIDVTLALSDLAAWTLLLQMPQSPLLQRFCCSQAAFQMSSSVL